MGGNSDPKDSKLDPLEGGNSDPQEEGNSELKESNQTLWRVTQTLRTKKGNSDHQEGN